MVMLSTVLVVEDDETLRTLMAEAIAVLGLGVIDCANADDALALLESTAVIALVVTDINMPGSMNGVELATIIWQRWPGLPVIVTSGNERAQIDQLPPHMSFLAKPWTLAAFHSAVGRSLCS